MESESEGENEDEEEKEEKHVKPALPSNKTEGALPIKRQRRSTNDGKTPFQFSVQKTRKLFPCLTCGKQYLEKRSLRRHALRDHGIVIPVRYRRTPRMYTLHKYTAATLLNTGNSNSERLYNKYLPGKKTIFNNFNKTSQNISNNVRSNESRNANTAPLTAAKNQYDRCALCRQKVKSVQKHLINYHKIGCSTNMFKQLETTLVIKGDPSSGSNKPTLKDILSGKPAESSAHRDTQNKSHAVRGEDRSREASQVPRKRKYTMPYVSSKKRFKMNNGHYVPVQNAAKMPQGHATSKTKYKCNICLGVYANPNVLAKHKRIHASRGETKENFHKFECKYFNSPLSKRYQQQMSSANQSEEAAKIVSNGSTGNVQSHDPKVLPNQNQKTSGTDRAAANDTEKEDTSCLCGRSFRTSAILRSHKDNCKLYIQQTQHSMRDEYSSDRDSGIGINITIKKRNNSYEIVAKDSDDDKPTDADGTSSPNVSHSTAKDATGADARRQQSGEKEASKYSKNHSILKLRKNEDENEDLIVDIENDVQLLSNRKAKQTATRQSNNKEQTRQDDAKEENVRTLTQMCEDVLKKRQSFQASEEDATTQPEKKRNLRSINTGHEKTDEKHVAASKPFSTAKFNLTTCAYCNEHFGTISLYNQHQCTIEEGKTFDDYSLNLLCFCCNVTLSSCSQFDEHMRAKHYDRAYHCYLCPEKFPSKKLRNKHTNMEHDTSCRFCHMDIPLWMVNLHEAYHLGFGYPCHECKKAYSSKRNLQYHITGIHKNGADTMVFCNLCLRSIKLKAFRSHMHLHDNNKCHFCSKEFNDRTSLEYHTLVYHGGSISKLKCNECSTRFLNKRQLDQHKKTCGNVKRTTDEDDTAKTAKHC